VTGDPGPGVPVPSVPIAIVGLACRLPGAESPDAFWDLLASGRDAVGEVPPDRWDMDEIYDPDPTVPGRISTRWGGCLPDVSGFDHDFFGISHHEATRMDPQQRLLLEVGWEALEDAGIVPERLRESRAGVFVGISTHDYARRYWADPTLIDAYAGVGSALSVAANRLSYLLRLRGPSLAVDTACSSSLVAVHLACRSLACGESSTALAGGVNLVLSPELTINFSRAGVMAPDGRCKTFDAAADGYVRGDGAGMVVLRTLADARRDGDPVYAVIESTAVNHNGRTNGLMAPSPRAQEQLLRDAHRAAGVSPADIQYVETHGTGTALGDAVEASALGAAFAGGRSARPGAEPVWIGSVKTNVGHLEAAAGITGLIKTALALRHRAVPPNLHFTTPNPHIPFARLGLAVPVALRPWPAPPGQARAGVSSFGFGGANAHAVLREPPAPPAPPAIGPGPGAPGQPRGAGAALLPLSAASPAALAELARRYRDLLRSPGGPAWADVAYSAARHRAHHPHRVAVTAADEGDAAGALDAFLAGEARWGLAAGHRPARPPGVTFVFSGHGSQWPGMARGLLAREPVFAAAVGECARAVRAHAGWRLLDVLAGPPTTDVAVVQPAIFAVQVGLAALWRSWGVEPAAVVGHSMGEVAAAHVAGALDLADAARIICRRGELLARGAGRGAMASIALPADDVRRRLADAGTPGGPPVEIAGVNSPAATVISGDPRAVGALVAELTDGGVRCTSVPIDVAAHHWALDPLREEFAAALAGIDPRPSVIPFHSSVASVASVAAAGGPEPPLDAEYWWRNLREPVMFAVSSARLAAAGAGVFLELSPHPLLVGAVTETLARLGRPGVALPSLRRDSDERGSLLATAGSLHALGCPLDWPSLTGQGGRFVPLPSYPWQRSRCWLEPPSAPAAPALPVSAAPVSAVPHPLLRRRLVPAADGTVEYWEGELRAEDPAYLADHQVDGAVVLPGSAYVELMFAVGTAALGAPDTDVEVADVEFRRAMFLPPGTASEVQVAVRRRGAGSALVAVHSRPAPGADRAAVGAWTENAVGTVRVADPPDRTDADRAGAQPPGHPGPPRPGGDPLAGADYYARLAERGHDYGPAFQWIERLWRADGAAVGELAAPAALAGQPDRYHIHPALLDCALQVLGAAAPGPAGLEPDRAAEPFLPVAIASVRRYGRPGPRPRSQVRIRPDAHGEVAGLGDATFEGDVLLVDEAGAPVAEVRGIRLRRLGAAPAPADRPAAAALYELTWQRAPATADPPPGSATAPEWIVVGGGDGIATALAERAGRARPGATVTAARPSADPAALTAALAARAAQAAGGRVEVVDLAALDWPAPDQAEATEPDEACAATLAGTVALVRALAAAGPAVDARLWLVTRGGQAVGGEAVSPAHAAVWGLGRTVAQEHPARWGGLVDLGPGGLPAEAAEAIWSTVAAAGPGTGSGSGAPPAVAREDQVAFRGRDRYVARYTRAPIGQASRGPASRGPASRGPAGGGPPGPRPDASYLITGGLGELGLLLAGWLVEHGARRLVLLSRAPAPARESWATLAPGSPAAGVAAAISALEHRGASVTTASVDVGDPAALAAFLDGYERERWPRIRGVVHAAGVAELAPVAELDEAALAATLRPKATGAWRLHRHFARQDLDFFVLFSSAAAVLGSPRLGAYAAANAFLDGLAHHRRALGLPALSINWGLWGEVGLAARRLREGHTLLRGVSAFSPAAGLEVFGQLLLEPERAQVAVTAIDWARWRRAYPAFTAAPLFEHVAGTGPDGTGPDGTGPGPAAGPGNGDGPGGLTRRRLLEAGGADRRALLAAHLRAKIARVVGTEAAGVQGHQPLSVLGIDSMMAVELRNQIGAELGVAVPIVTFLEGPTLDGLVTTVLGLLAAAEPAPGPAGPEPEPEGGAAAAAAADLLTRVDDLSDGDVDALLSQVLGQHPEEG